MYVVRERYLHICIDIWPIYWDTLYGHLGGYRIYSYLSPWGLYTKWDLRFEFKPPGAYKRNVLILHVMC